MNTDEQKTYEGSCSCGAVRVRATGTPFVMGYCHCDQCRAWSTAPVSAFMLWKRSDVSVTEGADSLATYKSSERSHRKFCARCGGHVMSDHPEDDFTDVYAVAVQKLNFEPVMHVFCKEAVVAITDELPRFVDLPSEFGGSGALIEG